MLTAISLGAGVQSSTMAMLAAHGKIKPMPDCAIFADTGAEPAYVYEYLEMLEDLMPFPVYTVREKDGLETAIYKSTERNDEGDMGNRFAGAPFYTTSDSDLGMGMLRRQCTREFKIQPITRKVRELVGLKYRQRAPKDTILAEQWIGISWDERQRMKEPREHWLRHRWPLIEMEWTRQQCLDYMGSLNLPLPNKSACTFCPYRTNNEWREMKEQFPDAFASAVKMDEAIRAGGTTEQLYVHRSMTPLADADLSDPAEKQIDWLDECDGMCGV